MQMIQTEELGLAEAAAQSHEWIGGNPSRSHSVSLNDRNQPDSMDSGQDFIANKDFLSSFHHCFDKGQTMLNNVE